MAAHRSSHQMNRIVVASTGEGHFLRDAGLLDGALARPQNAFAYGEEDIVAVAVRLLAGVAQAHAFEQGNKRTSFVAMTEFLMINGYALVIEDSQPWAEAVISLVEHRTTEEDLVRILRPFVVAVG
jgi:death on curing protein